MEAALEIFSDFSDVWDVDVFGGLFFPGVELNLIGEEELEVEVHELAVLLLIQVVVGEHSHTAADCQLAARLVLEDCAHWPVAGVGQRAGGQDGSGRGNH
jgi:hypothetical protein